MELKDETVPAPATCPSLEDHREALEAQAEAEATECRRLLGEADAARVAKLRVELQFSCLSKSIEGLAIHVEALQMAGDMMAVQRLKLLMQQVQSACASTAQALGEW